MIVHVLRAKTIVFGEYKPLLVSMYWFLLNKSWTSMRKENITEGIYTVTGDKGLYYTTYNNNTIQPANAFTRTMKIIALLDPLKTLQKVIISCELLYGLILSQ